MADIILTDEQRAKIDVYVKDWTAIGLCTDPSDRQKAEEAIVRLYQNAGYAVPDRSRFIWAGSPLGAALKYAWLLKEVYTPEQDKEMDEAIQAIYRGEKVEVDWAAAREGSAGSIYGQHDANWLAFFAFYREVCGQVEKTEQLVPLLDIAKSTGWIIPCDDTVIFSERPCVLKRNDRNQFHSLDGPALAYPDGWAVYAVNNVRLPGYIIEHPGQITLNAIEREPNAEIRRVMVDRYKFGQEVSGAAAYVKDSGAELIDHDEKYGTLYRKQRQDDDDILVLEVINSTPEPDGTYKHYFLRPHFECRPMLVDGTLGDRQKLTSLNAVASTFGMTGKEYAAIGQQT